MRYQHFLDTNELKKWLRIEVSLGSNIRLINESKIKLLNFLKLFDNLEINELSQITSINIPTAETQLVVDKTIVRMMLLKKFIDINNPLIIGEFLGMNINGKGIEKDIFIKLAKQLFSDNIFPEDIYTYCVFRRRGSPTTWLRINNDLTDDELKSKIDLKMKSLCSRLTFRLQSRRKLRMSQSANRFVIYLIEKPIGVEVVKSEDNNQEVQKVSYLLIILDLENKRIGCVSGSKREIYEVQSFIRQVLFPDQIYTLRNDIIIDAQELLKKILLVDIQDSILDIVSLSIKDSNLVKNPLIRVESKDNTSISEAISQIEPHWRNLDISNLGNAIYSIAGQRVELYSYGDEWKRRCLSIKSIGKSVRTEERFLTELKRILENEIKESRFVTETLGQDFIINKLIKDRTISTDPAIPEEVEKIIVNLVKQGLLKKPKNIAKRVCESYSCRTVSWSDWVCPNCGRSMIVMGNGITTEVSESKILYQLWRYLKSEFPGYDVVKQTIQRKGYKKTTIRLVSKIRDVAMYVVVVINKKDLNFAESLVSEGYGLITLCSPSMTAKKEILEAQGSGFMEISTIVSELKRVNENTQTTLKQVFMDLIINQEKNMLSRIYEQLKASEKAIKEKIDYDEDKFEIDIKNIMQSLIPNVVRLGTKFKGKSVPDGYCSFKYNQNSLHNLFGWDAKYSYSNSYRLGSKDFVKQQNYIKWLCSDSEPKSLGKLRIYGFVSNFNQIDGFSKVLSKLRRSTIKPRRCKIVLINDNLLCNLATWMLLNWKKVLQNGPLISECFFNWLVDKTRRTRDRWIYCTIDDWTSLEKKLELP